MGSSEALAVVFLIGDVLFAGDTLLIGDNSAHVEEYMAAVERCGLDYGLQLHWGKTQLVSVGTLVDRVRTPEGDEIVPSDSLVYLGATVHGNGKSLAN